MKPLAQRRLLTTFICLGFYGIVSGCYRQHERAVKDGSASNEVVSSREADVVSLEINALPVKSTNQNPNLTIGLGIQKNADSAELVWRSPNATDLERFEAVKRLVPPGSSIDLIRRKLGDDGVLAHYYGPSMGLTSGGTGEQSVQSGAHDFWQIEYRVQGGKVALRFKSEIVKGTSQLKFDNAYLVK